MGAILIHDLASRRRIHPVVGAAVALAVSVQVITTVVYWSPAWKPTARAILMA